MSQSPSSSSNPSYSLAAPITALSRDSDLCQTVEIAYLHPRQIDSLNSYRLGRGTYGFVEKIKYRKTEDHDYLPAAVKYSNDEIHKENLKREAKVMHSLGRHPNVLKIYGIYNSPQHGFGVVMEYMDCNSLSELIKKRDIEYSLDHFASWMYQLSLAVEFFHRQEKVHRDLKLQNILLSDKYRKVKVCDFGTFTGMHQSMTVNLGTPITMAPEVFKGEQYGTKSDIYSIGVIMWQIIARRDPYANIKNTAVLLFNVAEKHLRPEELSCNPILSGFYKRCWHYDPNTRPTSTQVREYFELLIKEYPNSDKCLIEKSTNRPVRTPQPRATSAARQSPCLPVGEKKTHRRAGSDQTTILKTKDLVGINPNFPELKDHKFATRLILNDGENQLAYEKIKEWFVKHPHHKPSEPNEGDTRSINIHNEHISKCAEIVNIAEIEQEILEAKHRKMIATEQNEHKLNLVERAEYLKKLIEKARLPMTPNQTNG